MTISISQSGGEIKAAFLAGILAKLLESGIEPNEVVGTSAGALNTFLVAGLSASGLTPKQIGAEIRHIYISKINTPDQFIKKRSALSIIRMASSELGLAKWQGLLDTSPLHTFVRTFFPSTLDLATSKIRCVVTSHNIRTGVTIYTNNTQANFIDYVLASTSVPLIMPPVLIDNTEYFDGGLTDYLPIPYILDVVIGCSASPIIIGQTGKDFNPYKLSHLIKRVINISADNTLKANIHDIKAFAIKSLFIYPDHTLPYSITSFTKQDILDMVNYGSEVASTKLKEL